jgi:hypothetical protein
MDKLFDTALPIVAIFGITAFMLKSWLAHREKMRELSLGKSNVSAADERLARMERAVEAIAIEVERVSEGQRFVTKLMSERGQPMIEGAPVQQRRVDTPH